MGKNGIKIKITGGPSRVTEEANGYYLITIDKDGTIGRFRQNMIENPFGRDCANDTVLAGAMIAAAEQLLRHLNEVAPNVDARAKAQEVYEEIMEDDDA